MSSIHSKFPEATSTLQMLDLSSCPPIYVSSTHFGSTEDLHGFEDDLVAAKAGLTYDINEAGIVLSKATQKKRVRLDLRSKGLFTEEASTDNASYHATDDTVPERPSSKRRKVTETASTACNDDEVIVIEDSGSGSASLSQDRPERVVNVVRIEWFADSKKAGRIQSLDGYLTYRGRVVSRQKPPDELKSATSVRESGLSVAASSTTIPQKASNALRENAILERAKADSPKSSKNWAGRRRFGTETRSTGSRVDTGRHGTSARTAPLLQQITTEDEAGLPSDVPEMPEWVKKGLKYACQRPTPKRNPNEDFIKLLKEIKTARLLTNDEIGVRAYSTSIASLAAYTFHVTNPREILALPGCDLKIADLWIEWKNTGTIQVVEDIRADADLKILREFYNIWGVGSITAREFYYSKGWQDLDDIIEQGWKSLSRVQQIGIKYYDEFLDPIPREEIEEIGEVIRQHAIKVRDERIQTMLVGSYRRGDEVSGDVDIIVTHPEESATANLVEDLVRSLEEDEWITHTLLLSLNSTKRGQQTLPFHGGGGGGGGGHGFDTLDKALVVWQNPAWPGKEGASMAGLAVPNPNIHRRVDIILSTWRTVGCAVVGWSGGTTFERDLRRYAKNVKSWKFDSSGVRSRLNGQVIDVEGYLSWQGREGEDGRAVTMEEAEWRVFESFELAYREPWERNTG